MDADQNGQDKRNSNLVTSIGNSWLIGRSKKTYPGRVYYFNTVTGEAAWNLSDAEIAKAKRRTRREGASIEICPEPEEPPMDQDNNNGNQNRNNMGQKSTPSKIYNKQVINNRFTKPAYPFSPFANSCNHDMGQAYGYLNPSAPMGLSLPAPTCNPSVWAVPPTHQIFIAPTPLVNHPQAAPMFTTPHDNVAAHNSTVPIGRRFQMQQNPTEYDNSSPRKHFLRTNQYDRYGHRNEGNFQRKFNKNFSSSSNDLRHLISSKRTQRKSETRLKGSTNEDNCSDIEGTEDINDSFMNGVEEEPQENIAKTKRKDDYNTEDNYHSDVDNDWLEENISFKGTKLHLDVTNLKKLAKSNAKTDCWYIAVDKTILTSHLNFLNILISSDEHCHLMVPQQVLQELRVIADTSHNTPRLRRRARRAVDFMSQQAEAGGALIGTDTTDVEIVSDYMIHCCMNLVQRNYHVVLLSNQNELRHKASSQIPIFNINELKKFLSSDREDKESSPEPSSQPSELPITITIPNDLIQISNESLEETHSSIDISMKENVSEPQCVKDKEINVQQNEIVNQLPNKHTVDAEVQTETTLVPKVSNALVSTKNLSDTPQPDDDNIQPSGNRVMTSNRSVEANNAMQANRSKSQVRLKRSRPQVSVGANNDFEQKSFRWRKRRDTTSTQTNECRLPSTSNSESGQPSTADLTSPREQLKIAPFGQSEKSNSKVHIGTQSAHQVSFDSMSQGSNIDDNILGSETSSCVYVRRNIGEITIEETSTSGVISNTSRGNSDCSSIPKVQLITNKSSARNDKPHHLHFDTPVVEIHIFEVTNQAMEHHLKMRCDEWLSRFDQIMEDVLAQVLHQHPSFLKDKFPPPWTLHEAAQCIKMNFSEDINIVDAATKLSLHLFEISDNRGRVKMPVRPSDFMKMYSYGVYLINALQSAIDSEDLHAAAENLSLLLSDIQNPNADYSHNETFGDNPHDVSATTSLATSRFESNIHNDDSNLGRNTFDSYIQNNVSNFGNETFESYAQTNDANLGDETHESNVQNNDSNLGGKTLESNVQNNNSNLGSKAFVCNVQNKDSNRKEHLDSDVSDNATEKVYNLRSKRKLEEKGDQQSVKFVRKIDIEYTFFTSLNLQKNLGEDGINKSNNTKSPITRPSKVTEQTNKGSVETKFVRKFTTCPQFEKKIKKNKPGQSTVMDRQPLDMDKLDYSANYDDWYIDNYCSEGDYYSDGNENEPVIKETNELERRAESLDQAVETDDNNNNVIIILKSFITEIITTFTRVRRFCDQVKDEYTLSEPTLSRMDEIHKKAETAQLVICNLSKSLRSLFYRESSESENTLQSLLGKAGLHNLDLSEKQFAGYRDIVANCIDNANTLLEALNLIVNAAKT